MRMLAVLLFATVAHADLRKDDLRPTLKALNPKITECYQRLPAKPIGVVNTMLTVVSEPARLMVTVNGFDTHGDAGKSTELLACMKATFEAITAPIAARGRLDFTYPFTFSPHAVDNRDAKIVDKAAAALKRGKWRDALATAERGLTLTTLDGTFRRRLIEVAGLAACKLKDDTRAKKYMALASPEVEARIAMACGL